MRELEEFDKEYAVFEDSVCFLTGEKEKYARVAFAKKIEDMIAKYPDCAKLYHMLGLCYYNFSIWEEKYTDVIELAFHRALIFDPKSIFSTMFLVFYYFDIGKFHLSLYFSRMLSNSDISDIPKWRLKKVEGLELACLIRLGVTNTFEVKRKLEELLISYSELDEDELDAAVPSEVILAIKDSEYIKNGLIKMQANKLEIQGQLDSG